MTAAWRLYLDQDSGSKALAEALEQRGFDCLASREVGRERATDESQLAYAYAEPRVLVTANQGDFARLHWSWMAAGRPHAGILIVSQKLGLTARINRFELLAEIKLPEEVAGSLIYLGSLSR
jgi:predicted nuclease of predicted toxin-antitoxin system